MTDPGFAPVRAGFFDLFIIMLTMYLAALQKLHTPWKDERHIEHLDKAGYDCTTRAGDPTLEQGNEYQAYGIIAEEPCR